MQSQGGRCEKCGIDFAKYAAMLVFRAQSEIAAQRDHTRARTAVWRQVLLFPLTGGLSLGKFLLGKLRGR
jgi:hypothetical protein